MIEATMTFTRRGFLTVPAAAVLRGAVRPPNVVMIYADDLGYGDLGCYGSKIRTPNLDRMAAEGVRFTNFCSANPVCSPSRAALLTGRYPTRVGVPDVLFPHAKTGLSMSETTMAEMLKTLGYRTQCVGKWHLGDAPEYLPTHRGFDGYLGIPYSNDMEPRVLLDGERVVENPATLDTLTQRYTERAVDFIAKSAGGPFFLYFPHTFPHIPLAASPRFRGKSALGLYGDAVEEVDWSVGRVLEAVRAAGQEANTLVMFSSDNGPWYQGSPGLLRGRKGMTWEGGVREPFIARWPGRVPAGRVCDALGSTMDILPTVARLTGAKLPAAPLDGTDIWPLLGGEKTAMERGSLLYFDGVNLQCARRGRWKLHVARYNAIAYGPAPAGGRKNLRLAPAELYDLANDPAESYDVAAEHPDVVRSIEGEIERLMNGFPDAIRSRYREMMTAPVAARPAGALPQPGKME